MSKVVNKNCIELRKSTSGNWVQMIINHRIVFQGPRIPDFIWLDVLADTNFDVSETQYDPEEEFE
jgi:hypothetical protein